MPEQLHFRQGKQQHRMPLPLRLYGLFIHGEKSMSGEDPDRVSGVHR